MSEDRQKTFGGTYRQLFKDVKDRRDKASWSILRNKEKDSTYLKGIYDLEIKILEAIEELEANDLWCHMGHQYHVTVHGFYWNWHVFRKVPAKWDYDDTLDKWEDSSKLFKERDWKGDNSVLTWSYYYLKNAKPKGHGHAHEWTEDYRDDTCLKDATQTQKISEETPNLIPSGTGEPQSTALISEDRVSTFGGAFRRFLKELNQLISLLNLSISKESSETTKYELERIQNQKILIRNTVESLSSDSNSVECLKVMGTGLTDGHKVFMNYWEWFRSVSSEWEESISDYKNPHIDREQWEQDRDSLAKVYRKFRWGIPWRMTRDAEWKDDYKEYKKPEPLCMTFGGTFRRLMADLKEIGRLIELGNVDSVGQDGHREDWTEVETLVTKAKDYVPLLSKHPFLEHLVLGVFETHEAFMYDWFQVEKLSQEWENSISTWKGKETVVHDRDWKADHKVLMKLQLESAKPERFTENSEWENDYLPASKLTVKMPVSGSKERYLVQIDDVMKGNTHGGWDILWALAV